jgi:serine-type D-Ala-D-Ala carboxypeptidase
MRTKLLLFFFLSLGVCQGQPGNAETAQTILVKTVDSILESQVNLNLIPGAVILIKNNNQVIYRSAHGYARKHDRYFRELKNPDKMTAGTLFDIASLTKVIGTTTAIMWLVDHHQIAVDDPVSKYIPAFDTAEKNKITIRHLLTHTSGLMEWYPLYSKATTREEAYALIAALPLQDSVGKQRKYSDLGFTLLGEIIERVGAMPLEEFLQEKIFAPLGMKNTLYNPLKKNFYTKIAATSFGNPYEKRMVYDSSLGFTHKEVDLRTWKGWRNYELVGEVNDGNAWYACGGVSGAAGLFSTVDDLQRLVDLLMNQGVYEGKPFISKTTVDQFLTMDQFRNGLGWMMDPANSFMKNGPTGTFGHTGFTGTSIAVIPKYKTSVILLVNRQQTGLLQKGEYYNLNPVREQIFQAVMDFCANQTK